MVLLLSNHDFSKLITVFEIFAFAVAQDSEKLRVFSTFRKQKMSQAGYTILSRNREHRWYLQVFRPSD